MLKSKYKETWVYDEPIGTSKVRGQTLYIDKRALYDAETQIRILTDALAVIRLSKDMSLTQIQNTARAALLYGGDNV